MKCSRMVALVALAGIGCVEPQQSDGDQWTAKSRPIRDDGALKGCTLTYLKTPGTLPNLYVVRCPHSDTTTQWMQGKVMQRTSVVETPDMGGQ